MELYFLIVALGSPVLFCVLALIAANAHTTSNSRLFDWAPTRTTETEMRLKRDDLDQMLNAVNRYRHARGLPSRTLQELTGRQTPNIATRNP